MAQLAHCTGLDLTDALTGEVERLADFLQRARLAAVETEAQREDLSLALVERCEQARDLLGQEGGGGDFERRLRGTVLDHVAEFGVSVLAQWFRQRERLGSKAQCLGDLVLGHVDFGRQLRERCWATELQLEARASLLQAGERVTCVHRKPDGATCVGDAAGDRLADPPRCIRRELESLAPVELLDGVHEAQVAFLDEIQKWQAGRLVLLGDRHDEAEVRLHELSLRPCSVALDLAQLAASVRVQRRVVLFEFCGRALAGLDGLGESDFVVFGEEGVLADVGEIETYEVFFVTIDTVFCHNDSFRGERA